MSGDDLLITKALKKGSVPRIGAQKLMVGREAELLEMQEELIHVAAGGAVCRFFSGDYGSGKTFMCRLAADEAFAQNFCVSIVNLSRDVPLSKPEIIYAKIMAGIRTKEVRTKPAFRALIQSWLVNIERQISQTDDLNPLNPIDQEKIGRLVQQRVELSLGQAGLYDASFGNAFRGFYKASKANNALIADAAIGWLMGDPNMPADLRKAFNVKGAISKTTAFEFLRAVVTLITQIGYSGLLVVMDEAELIARLSTRAARDASYETLRALIDACGADEFSHTMFLIAGTQELFVDEGRGIPSYQALHDRIKLQQSASGFRDVRQTVMMLDGLTRDYLEKLGRKVRVIHGSAHQWDPLPRVTDSDIDALVDMNVKRFGEEVPAKPRTFLKALVDVLDLAQQNPSFNANEITGLQKIVDEAAAVEEIDATLEEGQVA